MSKALLAVSFGTAYAETRKMTIDAIENDLRSAFPERRFYRAWTSSFIRKKLRERDGIVLDSVQEALERMLSEGVDDLLVQPTHMTDGEEYAAVREQLAAYAGKFSRVLLGAPLLASEEDISLLAKALEETFSYVSQGEMLALMGHGSARQMAVNPYLLLDSKLGQDGYPNFCIGTVEFEPGFEPVMLRAKERRPGRIYIAPLLIVAGDHAENDMAGEDEGSWKSMLSREGFDTECILKGLGEYAAVREMYVSHAKNAEEI